MLELTDEGKLNFGKSFLHFTVKKKKYMQRFTLKEQSQLDYKY